jgi:hypothetical protein
MGYGNCTFTGTQEVMHCATSTSASTFTIAVTGSGATQISLTAAQCTNTTQLYGGGVYFIN